MTKHFHGNSLAAFKRNLQAIAENTSAGTFDSSFVSKAIYVPSGLSGYIESYSFSASGTLWLRTTAYGNVWVAYTANEPLLTVLNGSANVFRIVGTGSGNNVKAQYWNGSAWTDTGSAFLLTASTLQILAVRIDLNSGFKAYLGGSEVASGTGWTGGATAATLWRLSSCGSVGGFFFSESMASDYDIRSSHLKAAALNGNSASNTGAASGVYTDVNETILDDSTAIAVSTSGNKAGQTKASITVPNGYVIGGMGLNARGRISGTITDGKLGIRSGGSNYSGSALSYSAGYEPRGRVQETDPATGVAFTQSGFNNAEPYLEAV